MRSALALAAVLAGLPIAASAQLGPARAGSLAQADNAATASSNPAGLTRLKDEQFVLDTMILYSQNEFEVKPGTTTTGGDPRNNSELSGIPSLAWSRPMSESLWAGFSVSVPAGIGTDYGDSWAGRYQAQSSSLFFVNLNPVLAWKVNDWLSLGAGVSAIYASFDSEVAVNNPAPGAPDGQMELELSGWGFGGNVAALFEPTERTRFGLSYRLESEPKLEGRPDFSNLPPAITSALRQKIELDMTVPQMLLGGFHHQLRDDLAVMGDLAWIDFSSFGKVDLSVGPVSTTVDNHYNDIWAGSLGLRYLLSERWAASLGYAYVSSGVDDEDRTLALPWDDFHMIGAGIEYQLRPHLRLFSSLTFVQGGDGKIDQQATPLSGRLVGEFTQRRTFLLSVALVWDR